MDMINCAKNLAAILAIASTIAYISGYLALRARALALGIDPAFTLVDEVYVFAGVRFLLITLIIILLVSPLIFVIRAITLRLHRQMPLYLINPIHWLMLVVAAMWAFMSLGILSVQGILLQEHVGASDSIFKEAIMGGQIGMLLTFSLVISTLLLALWLRERLTSSVSLSTCVLGGIVFLLVFMLPVYHGALYADRYVRVLAATPDAVKALKLPLAIVDHTSDQYTLLGLDADGNHQLTTLKSDDLNGIPIQRIVKLDAFIKNDLALSYQDNNTTGHPGTNRESQTVHASQQTYGTDSTALDANIEEEFFSALLNHLQITFEAIGSLSGNGVDSGQLWMVDIDASGKASHKRRVGSFDDLSWPVVGLNNSTVFALQQGQVVKIGQDKASLQRMHTPTTWHMLIGITKDGSIVGLINDSGKIKPAILSSDGKLRVNQSSLSKQNETRKVRLLQEARSYANDRSLSVDRSKRGGRGFDIIMRSGEAFSNLSDCGDDSCGQASFSADFGSVVFIRQPRY